MFSQGPRLGDRAFPGNQTETAGGSCGGSRGGRGQPGLRREQLTRQAQPVFGEVAESEFQEAITLLKPLSCGLVLSHGLVGTNVRQGRRSGPTHPYTPLLLPLPASQGDFTRENGLSGRCTMSPALAQSSACVAGLATSLHQQRSQGSLGQRAAVSAKHFLLPGA